MATEGERIGLLRDFFVGAFTASELEMFLTVKGYGEVASAVNQSVGGMEYFFGVAQALVHRGRIDDAFFAHLVQERPAKRTITQDLQGRLRVEPPVSSAALSPPRNALFVPRVDRTGGNILDALLANPETVHRVVLHGMPAVGKTQAALEYAYRYSEDHSQYSDVFWTIVETEDQLRAGLLGVAARLGLPTDRPVPEVLNAVKAQLERREGWLWVLDNARDMRMVTRYLPAQRAGRVLITTTRPESELRVLSALPIELTHFLDHADGARFLLTLAGLIARDQSLEAAEPEDAADARALSEEVGGLPLALDQAAAYIEATRSVPSQYLEQYRRRGEALRRLRTPIPGDDRDHANVAVTFEIIFARLEDESPATANLLCLLAFFVPGAIPEEILSVGAPVLGDRLGPAVSEDLPLLLVPALRDRLLTRDPRSATLIIHRLVQDVLRDRMGESSRILWAERAVRALNLAVPEVERLDLDQIDRTLSHLLACAEHIDRYAFRFSEAGRLLDKTGCQLYFLARYDESLKLLDRALTITEAALGSDHPDTARTLNNKAILLAIRTDFRGAEVLFRRALEIRETRLGPDHADVATTFNNLGGLLRDLGRLSEAEPLLRRALAIRETGQEPNSAHTATTLNVLGNLLRDLGKLSEAEPLLRRALAIRERLQGPDHPETAGTLDSLARLLQDQRKLSEAESLFRRALEFREKGLGLDHPDTSASLNNLALLLQDQGRLSEAEFLIRRGLAIREKSPTPDHRGMAAGLNNLARLLQDQGKLTEAEPLFRRALVFCERVLGPDHPNTATTLNNLAALLQSRGKLSEAEPIHRRALAIRERILGTDHPDTTLSLNNLAFLLKAQGKLTEAEPLFQRAWMVLEKTYGPGHEQTRSTLLSYLATLQGRGRRAELRSVLTTLDPKLSDMIKAALRRPGE